MNYNIKGKRILITGGSGTLGHTLVDFFLELNNDNEIIVFSRDEYKQFLMMNKYKDAYDKGILKFYIGDIRDEKRLKQIAQGVNVIIHAAAQKQVPSCENNVQEAIKTNIDGAINVRNAAIEMGVDKVVALSTDKAVMPINLYGATKMVSDRIFLQNDDGCKTIFSVVRYGNVANSRGSVIPLFKRIRDNKEKIYPVTDEKMTRFWVGLDDAVGLIKTAIETSCGGEVFIAKTPSFKILDLVKAFDRNASVNVVGIREGEKINETLIGESDSIRTVDAGNKYIIYKNSDLAEMSSYNLVPRGFVYSSDNNEQWLCIDDLIDRLGDIYE